MKSLATINFKGGVGKTTVTWLLAKYITERLNKKVLLIDTDAQMCLTLAVQLEQDKGKLNKSFDNWLHQHKDSQKTLVNIIESYEKLKGDVFNFSINSLIYKINDRLHLIPSNIDMYWFEYDITDREKVKSFVKSFLQKFENKTNFDYDYVFFDCPPYFNSLSYSVISCASLVLIPVNPDALASKPIYNFIEGLINRLKPLPNPKISIFMNKAKTLTGDYLSPETKNYINELKKVKSNLDRIGTNIEVLDSYIPECTDYKTALPYAIFEEKYEEYLSSIWQNIAKQL